MPKTARAVGKRVERSGSLTQRYDIRYPHIVKKRLRRRGPLRPIEKHIYADIWHGIELIERIYSNE